MKPGVSVLSVRTCQICHTFGKQPTIWNGTHTLLTAWPNVLLYNRGIGQFFCV